MRIIAFSCAVLISASASASGTETSTPTTYQPFLSLSLSGMELHAPISLATRFEGIGGFALDDKEELKSNTLNSQIRVGLVFDSKLVLKPILLKFEYEHDLITGTNVGRTDLEGIGLPASDETTHQLRKIWGRASLGWYLHLAGGLTTSHWGMGLVANDGNHGFSSGKALFIDPRGGDRVIRGMIATGPHYDTKVVASLAIDSVVDDDSLLDGDSAIQVTGALITGRGEPNSLGIYAVMRSQEAEDGDTIDVVVLDVAGKAELQIGEETTLGFEGELAYITGDTTLGGTPEFPTHDIDQFAAAFRGRFDAGLYGGVLDLFYASGDGNLDDSVQNGFKADPNFPMGFILYRQLLAGQTGRSPITANNPNIIGVPPQDLERFPTRGSLTGSIGLFPRAFVRPIEGLEVYGGALLAFAMFDLSDPFNTRLAGSPKNALDSTPGSYLGTELDLGLRYEILLFGTLLSAGLEGGVLFPGSAFDAADGSMKRIFAGRAMVRYQL